MSFRTRARHQQATDESLEFANYGPFELLQARQLIESNIAEFAATQVTKQDIMKLMDIQEHARNEKCFRDSEWDLQFHIQVALATQNSALKRHRRKMWTQRSHNPYWKKLHEHIDARTVDNWCDDHDQILKALIRKDPNAAKLAMWQHWRIPKSCCSTRPAMILSSTPIVIFLQKIRSFISIRRLTALNKQSFRCRRDKAPVSPAW